MPIKVSFPLYNAKTPKFTLVDSCKEDREVVNTLSKLEESGAPRNSLHTETSMFSFMNINVEEIADDFIKNYAYIHRMIKDLKLPEEIEVTLLVYTLRDLCLNCDTSFSKRWTLLE
jgi:hypothetical protein